MFFSTNSIALLLSKSADRHARSRSNPLVIKAVDLSKKKGGFFSPTAVATSAGRPPGAPPGRAQGRE
jgi:hypothetical protein